MDWPVMMNQPTRRIPLRDLLTDAEKRVRDMIDHFHVGWATRASDLRELSRPVRKKSHFPTLVALKHSLERLQQLDQEGEAMLAQLIQELEEISLHARRERQNRM